MSKTTASVAAVVTVAEVEAEATKRFAYMLDRKAKAFEDAKAMLAESVLVNPECAIRNSDGVVEKQAAFVAWKNASDAFTYETREGKGVKAALESVTSWADHECDMAVSEILPSSTCPFVNAVRGLTAKVRYKTLREIQAEARCLLRDLAKAGA